MTSNTTEPSSPPLQETSLTIAEACNSSGSETVKSIDVSQPLLSFIIAVYSPDGSQFLGAVSCLEDDVGYMTIPGSYFQQFPNWSLTAVHLIRHRTGETFSDELGGILQWHMLWEVIGTGHIE